MPQQFGTPERRPGEDDDLQDIVEAELDDLVLDEDEYSGSDEEDMIEFDETDDSIAVNESHSGFVFAIAMSAEGDGLCLSGGEDDFGYLWKKTSGEEVFKIEGHKDSVCYCGFSYDSKYFYTADLAGTVIIHKTQDRTKSWTFECSDIEWSFWHISALVLFAGTADGDVYMWKVPSGECKIFQGHGCKTTNAALLPSGKNLYVCYEDGLGKLWDLKTSTTLHTIKDQKDAITDVAVNKNGTLVASACVDATVNVINVTTGKACAMFDAGFANQDDEDNDEANQEGTTCSVEAVAFCTEQQLLATGSLSGVLAIWDLSNQRLRHKCPHPAGITRLAWSPYQPHEVLTCCLDGIVRCYDARTGLLLKTWQGHTAGILDIATDRKGEVFAVSSEDGKSRVFKL